MSALPTPISAGNYINSLTGTTAPLQLGLINPSNYDVIKRLERDNALTTAHKDLHPINNGILETGSQFIRPKPHQFYDSLYYKSPNTNTSNALYYTKNSGGDNYTNFQISQINLINNLLQKGETYSANYFMEKYFKKSLTQDQISSKSISGKSFDAVVPSQPQAQPQFEVEAIASREAKNKEEFQRLHPGYVNNREHGPMIADQLIKNNRYIETNNQQHLSGELSDDQHKRLIAFLRAHPESAHWSEKELEQALQIQAQKGVPLLKNQNIQSPLNPFTGMSTPYEAPVEDKEYKQGIKEREVRELMLRNILENGYLRSWQLPKDLKLPSKMINSIENSLTNFWFYRLTNEERTVLSTEYQKAFKNGYAHSIKWLDLLEEILFKNHKTVWPLETFANNNQFIKGIGSIQP
jgi:hypothetical protein